MSQQVENLSKDIEITKKKQIEFPELKITRSEIKNWLEGLNSSFG